MSKVRVCTGNEVDVSQAPDEIKILPRGLVESQKGDFLVDDESVNKIINHFKDRKLDIVIDYEHQTLTNTQAPAGGWIKELYPGEDSIIAKVEWTTKAKEYLANREYRYLSPVVITRKSDNKAIEIHSVALTNTPAIDGMFPIVNSMNIDNYEDEGGTTMDLEKLIALLGLGKDATEDDVLKAIAEAVKGKEPQKPVEKDPVKEETEMVANSTVLGLLGLTETAKTEDVVTQIMALKTGDVGVLEEIRALKAKMEQKEADDIVLMALKAGKITANQKDWAKAYALKDNTGFQKFVAAAPQVVPMEKVDYADSPKEQIGDIDTKVLKNMGLSDEDIEKYVKGAK